MKESIAAQSTEEFSKKKMRILAELTRLRQICCDPSLCFEGYKGEAAKLEYGDIVCLGMAGGKITVRKVEVIEVGDQSPEAVEAYVRTAFQFMPDSLRLDLIGELSRLLQKKEG